MQKIETKLPWLKGDEYGDAITAYLDSNVSPAAFCKLREDPSLEKLEFL